MCVLCVVYVCVFVCCLFCVCVELQSHLFGYSVKCTHNGKMRRSPFLFANDTNSKSFAFSRDVCAHMCVCVCVSNEPY